VIGKIIEEHTKREKDKRPNSITVQKKRWIDTPVRKLSEEELKRGRRERKWKSVEESQLKTGTRAQG